MPFLSFSKMPGFPGFLNSKQGPSRFHRASTLADDLITCLLPYSSKLGTQPATYFLIEQPGWSGFLRVSPGGEGARDRDTNRAVRFYTGEGFVVSHPENNVACFIGAES
jgi:hypothetical protein